MKAKTKIPELEASLEENRKRRWTPEINDVLKDYYEQFASDSDLKTLTAFINDKFGTNFNTADITAYYHRSKGEL